MKKIVLILIVACLGMSAKAQFPTMDSLRNFTNRYIRNSAVEAFQNLRLNTVLNGLSRFIDSARAGGGGAAADKLTTISSNTTASTTANIYLVNTTSNSVTLTINPNTFYTSGTVIKIYVKKITNNFNSVTITPSSGTINGASSYTLTVYNESVTIISNGTNLFTL